ncbi:MULTISPECIES: hypothetical protein [unclassified Haloferax]|uniref:hypothetical protein n=1 Tax=unclassified Haloferax TaxID=2625095 RepID=UPI000A765B17|nr:MULTISPECIES: hypothetical protein [unclassified Haloferax]MDS0242253.1 hypothetical protein [Haloferax sp. S2CR25]MDS0445374.1 hypothetical protein [Haloferax sp. S2CR25-2]
MYETGISAEYVGALIALQSFFGESSWEDPLSARRSEASTRQLLSVQFVWPDIGRQPVFESSGSF